MRIAAAQLFSNRHPVTWPGKVAQFPLMRIMLALLFLAPVLALNKAFKLAVYPALSQHAVIAMRYLEVVLFLCLFFVAYRFYVRYVEKRAALEFGFKGWFKEMGAGFLISAALVTAVVAVMALSGCYHVRSLNESPRVALDWLMKFLMGAFLEELLFRLILFKLTEELLGSWPALALQALLFGFSHLGNENATLFTSCAIAIIGGLLYTAAYLTTRRLWFPLGLHLGWNYFQSGIFGMPNSGSAYKGLLVPAITGPVWLTGGAFGIEASYIAIALCLVAGLVLLERARRSGQLLAPSWRRQ